MLGSPEVNEAFSLSNKMQIDECTYSGRVLSFGPYYEKEIRCRTSIGWVAFGKCLSTFFYYKEWCTPVLNDSAEA